MSSAALSITSTSKAVACAVISTAGNVTTRPTAQTTTSARAMVSGKHQTTLRASEAAPALLRPSSAADVGWHPCPSPPPAEDSAQRPARGAPRELPGSQAAPGPDFSMQPTSLETEKVYPGRGGGSRSLRCRGELVPWATQKQEMGGQSAARCHIDPTVSVRQRAAAFPRSVLPELRIVPAALPPRLRAAPPAPLHAPSPQWGLGGGRDPTGAKLPTSAARPALRTGERPGRFPQRWTPTPAPRLET